MDLLGRWRVSTAMGTVAATSTLLAVAQWQPRWWAGGLQCQLSSPSPSPSPAVLDWPSRGDHGGSRSVTERLWLCATGVRRVTWFQFSTYRMHVYLNRVAMNHLKSRVTASDGVVGAWPAGSMAVLRLYPTRATQGHHLRTAFEKLLTEHWQRRPTPGHGDSPVPHAQSQQQVHQAVPEVVKRFVRLFPRTVLRQDQPVDIELRLQDTCASVCVHGEVDGEVEISDRWLTHTLLRLYVRPDMRPGDTELIPGLTAQVLSAVMDGPPPQPPPPGPMDNVPTATWKDGRPVEMAVPAS